MCHQGENPDWAALLHSGHVKVRAHTPDGNDVVLAICGPDTRIGDVSALDGLPRSATVTMLDDVAAVGQEQPGDRCPCGGCRNDEHESGDSNRMAVSRWRCPWISFAFWALSWSGSAVPRSTFRVGGSVRCWLGF
ncbi:cyclic nucleotide-binding domain-containing protein [Dactylosporangium sp. NPDC050588]|uniref:Crp/Fnr family transcriptional regulator n=1 Tax=Dactylosporangium sp. NPDC050588 TaxID=3157211 RepID=UPI0033D7941C